MTGTTTEQTSVSPDDQRGVDAIGIASPVLAVLSLVLAIATSDLNAKFTHVGLTLMLVCMAGHVYHFRGKPPSARLPVRATPTALMLLGGFCAGTIICGLGMTGPFGLATQYAPTILVILTGAWFHTPAGKAKRARMADGAPT